MERLDPAKEALRAVMRERLRDLAPARRALQEELVTAAVQADRAWKAARTVGLYKSRPPEFSTVGLTLAAWRAGKRTVFPRVGPDGTMEFAQVATWAGFGPGAFGLEEPVPGAPVVSAAEVDLLLVPGLAFDAHGGRLGRGGGYYDRFLAGFQGVAWGVSFDEQMADQVPRAPHDRVVARVWHSAALT